jgi:hypothetical protein
MSFKYSDKPQVGRNATSRYNMQLPAGSLPIASVPLQSATPIQVHDADGKTHWALYHRNEWQKLAPFKDHRSGAINWRMCGERVAQPVAWSPRKK